MALLNACITGATSGIGLYSAISLASTQRYRVIVTGRNAERGAAAVNRIKAASNNKNVLFVQGDCSSSSSVDALASAVLSELGDEPSLDLLINNAGFMGGFEKNADGLEMHFAINVLAPIRLSHALLPALSAASSARGEARVVNVTGGDAPAKVDPDNLQAEKGFKGLMTYTHAKSALEAASLDIAGQFERANVTVNVVFPGRATTTMTKSLSLSSLPGPMKLFYPCFKMLFREDGGKSAERASKSTFYASTSEELKGVSGKYFDMNSKEQKFHKTALDVNIQLRIREVVNSVG